MMFDTTRSSVQERGNSTCTVESGAQICLSISMRSCESCMPTGASRPITWNGLPSTRIQVPTPSPGLQQQAPHLVAEQHHAAAVLDVAARDAAARRERHAADLHRFGIHAAQIGDARATAVGRGGDLPELAAHQVRAPHAAAQRFEVLSG